MKANEINLNRFLAQTETQFIIPVYQRNYDWNITQCKQLLADIFELGTKDNLKSHFIGSIVYVHDDVYSASGINELIIIDGQQRLTTVTLIYLVLYWLADESGENQLKNRINDQYLINKYSEEESSKLKLRPTENNDKALRYLLRKDKDEEFQEFSRLIENFNFFRTQINQENYKYVFNGLNKLMFVEISLDRNNDDPQKIFESLNSTGLELSQADLIRNYILMGLSRAKQNVIYKKYWEVIENLAKDENSNQSKVSDFIRDFITLKSKKIPNKNKVYQEFKNNYSVEEYDNLEIVLSELKLLAKFYNKLINPKNESDQDVRSMLYYIDKLSIMVSYPFLMKVYSDYSDRTIDKTQFLEVLELVQSFVWRRVIIGLPTNALNKIFMRLYEDIDKAEYVDSIARSLKKKKGTQRFPKDIEIINSLKEKDLYNIKPKNRTYLLEKLENHNNNEKVSVEGNSKITIEHIFPQNPEPKWKLELGEEEFNFIKNNYLHTIANLTLSGNNGALGNKSFLKKRDMNQGGNEQGYKFSRLWLNRYISNLEKWDRDSIEKRFNIITQRFLEIWKYPSVEIIEEGKNSEVNIFDADDPTNKKLEYAIFFDEKIETTKTSVVYKNVLTQLFELQPETFFTTYLTERICLTKKPQELRQPAKLNDTYFYEANYDNKGKFERLKQALELFGFEDELIVKYQKQNGG